MERTSSDIACAGQAWTRDRDRELLRRIGAECAAELAEEQLLPCTLRIVEGSGTQVREQLGNLRSNVVVRLVKKLLVKAFAMDGLPLEKNTRWIACNESQGSPVPVVILSSIRFSLREIAGRECMAALSADGSPASLEDMINDIKDRLAAQPKNFLDAFLTLYGSTREGAEESGIIIVNEKSESDQHAAYDRLRHEKLPWEQWNAEASRKGCNTLHGTRRANVFDLLKRVGKETGGNNPASLSAPLFLQEVPGKPWILNVRITKPRDWSAYVRACLCERMPHNPQDVVFTKQAPGGKDQKFDPIDLIVNETSGGLYEDGLRRLQGVVEEFLLQESCMPLCIHVKYDQWNVVTATPYMKKCG